MKVTTVKDLERYARSQGKSLEALAAEAELVAFMGDWSNPENEVFVPTGYPIGRRVPVGYVIGGRDGSN